MPTYTPGTMMHRHYLIMEALFGPVWNRKMEPMLLDSQLADEVGGGSKTSSRGGKDAEVYRTTLFVY